MGHTATQGGPTESDGLRPQQSTPLRSHVCGGQTQAALIDGDESQSKLHSESVCEGMRNFPGCRRGSGPWSQWRLCSVRTGENSLICTLTMCAVMLYVIFLFLKYLNVFKKRKRSHEAHALRPPGTLEEPLATRVAGRGRRASGVSSSLRRPLLPLPSGKRSPIRLPVPEMWGPWGRPCPLGRPLARERGTRLPLLGVFP